MSTTMYTGESKRRYLVGVTELDLDDATPRRSSPPACRLEGRAESGASSTLPASVGGKRGGVIGESAGDLRRGEDREWGE